MFQKIDYVMVMVSDMKKSIEFYRDQLGIPLRFESPGWTEFQTGSTTLALHGGAGKRSSGADDHNSAGSCSIGFQVENLQQTYEELKSKGVTFIMPPTVQEEENIRLAVSLDPDGLPVSIAEILKKQK